MSDLSIICGVHGIRNKIKIYQRDLSNLLSFGLGAPLFAERLWINLNLDMLALEGDGIYQITHNKGRKSSAIIIDNWPDNRAFKAVDAFKVSCCFEHFENGVSWEDTGIVDYMYDLVLSGQTRNYVSKTEIVNRYHRLDGIFAQLRKDRRLLTRKELDRNAFREYGGVLFHIGPQGKPYFGMAGQHRFAMCLILGIKKVPAQIGCVHVDALHYLHQLRKFDESGRNKIGSVC